MTVAFSSLVYVFYNYYALFLVHRIGVTVSIYMRISVARYPNGEKWRN